jgi:hypothetical protein
MSAIVSSFASVFDYRLAVAHHELQEIR